MAGPAGLGPWLLLVDGHGDADVFARIADLLGAETLDATDPDRALLPARLDTHQRLVVAGPGCGFHLARWRTVADRLGAHLAAVVVVRNPAEQFGPGQADAVAHWLDLVLDFENATRSLPHSVVRYEELLADWRATVRRIEKETGIPLLGAASLADLSESETGELPALREPDWAGLGLPAELRDLVARTYAALCSVADGVGDLGFVDTLRAERAAANSPAGPVVAVLLAGGVGSRLGGHLPKQLLEIGGQTILERGLTTLHDHPAVDEVVVVMAPGHLGAAHSLTAGGRYPKVTTVIEGGATRTESTRRSVEHLGDRDCVVLVHDAARPLVSARIITDCVGALSRHDAVAVAVPSTDTVLEVDADGFVRGIPPRTTMQRAQTPQGFRLSVLRDAFARATADGGFEATDDCALVLRYRPDVPIAVVAGDEANLKVTRPGDLALAEQLLRTRGDTADGAGAAASPS